jgi:uncharacterized protein involved in exopolysaccharide biosynthesis
MFNQQSAANLTMNIQNLESQITANEGTQGNLRAQLATVSPYSRVLENGQVLTTPDVQLKALKTQYATLTSQYGSDHPDVVKARHQIEALKAQIGAKDTAEDNSAQLEAQLADVRANLAAARKTFGPDHPDVTSLAHQLAGLENARNTALSHSHDPSGFGIKRDADNPTYLELSAQLMAAEEQRKSLLAQHDGLMAQKAKYDRAIAMDPDIEREMDKLSRDYDNSQLRYRDLKEKKMIADINEQLEVGRKGQRLVVTNPPEVPGDTHPSHKILLLGGILLSLLGGAGSVVIAEFMNQSIHGAEHLSQLLGALPLVTVPYIASKEEKTAHGRFTHRLRLFKAHASVWRNFWRNRISRQQKTA